MDPDMDRTDWLNEAWEGPEQWRLVANDLDSLEQGAVLLQAMIDCADTASWASVKRVRERVSEWFDRAESETAQEAFERARDTLDDILDIDAGRFRSPQPLADTIRDELPGIIECYFDIPAIRKEWQV